MGPGNKTAHGIETGKSGAVDTYCGVTPTLVVLSLEGVKEDECKLDDAARVRLWIVNHIDAFCLNKVGQNTDWRHWATDHEGLLIMNTPGRTWADISDIGGPDQVKYQAYFTTIPLIAPIDPVCNVFCSQAQGGLSVSIQENIPRPYPEDPFFIRLAVKDLPINFLAELKTISPDGKVSYDVGRCRLKSEPKMPDTVRDQLINIKRANRFFKAAVKILHSASQNEVFSKIRLLKMPAVDLPRAGTTKKLRFWETVMFRDSTAPELDKYRKLMNQKLFAENDFVKLRKLLNVMKGRLVSYYDTEKKPPMPPRNKYPFPWVVYDGRSTPSVIFNGPVGPNRKAIKYLCGMGGPGIMRGPLWALSIYKTSDEAAVPLEEESETSPPADPQKAENEKPPLIKGGMALYQMCPAYKLPAFSEVFPAVDDPVIDEIKWKSADWMRDLYVVMKTEADLRFAIQAVLDKKKMPPGVSKFLSCFFYVGEAEMPYEAMMMALDGAINHMRCRSEVRMMDMMSFNADPIMAIEQNVIVGFGTGCDGYSESPNPKHVYTQLTDWYQSLDETEKEEVNKSYEIDIRGYTSPYGEKGQVNIELRNNRAWKIAQSLKLILEKENMKIELRGLKANEEAPRTRPPDPKIKFASVPLYYKGEPKFVYPTQHLKQLFAPLGSTLCDIMDSSPAAQGSIQGLPPDNDPKDRIGWIIFRRSEQRKYMQYVTEKGKYESAGALAGYRMLGHAKIEKEVDDQKVNIVRVLLYVIPAFWR